MKKKSVLAFSGGLDTSYCVKYLNIEKDYDVYSVIVNTGGFDAQEISEIEKRALMLGVKEHHTIDITDEYYERCIRYLIYGNVLKNHTYPLSVSAERVFQAMALAEFAKEIGADNIVHGSTGAGNDQIRFDMIFSAMVPEIEIITPIRDQQISRDEEIAYLKDKGVDLDWSKTQYSINKGLWGTSVGGIETLTSQKALPEEAYPTKVTKNDTMDITLEFEKGEFRGFNGRKFDKAADAISSLDALAAPYGIGRDIHVGDTIIGIKGRVGFEAAAPVLIIKAHEALEKHTLSKWQIYWKEKLADWYGMLLHEGQYLDPVMRDIEKFMDNSQQYVNGKVFVKIAPYHFSISGIDSPNDLMSPDFGAYGEMNLAWSGEDAKGFAKILANQIKIHRAVNGDKND
jgi:argininosuccinate synthase